MSDDESLSASPSYRAFTGSPHRSVKYDTYFHVYDRLFGAWRGRPVTFCEIGVLHGGSLFMWREFLGPDARIIGVDVDPEAKRWESEGFEIFVGDQGDPEFWSAFFAKVGDLDVLLDDGGHTFEQQVVTTECVLPRIRDGGLLVVEDCHTSYMREYGGPSRYSYVSYAKNLVDGINRRWVDLADRGGCETRVYGIRFYESFVVYEIDRPRSVRSQLAVNGGQRNATIPPPPPKGPVSPLRRVRNALETWRRERWMRRWFRFQG